MKKVLITVGVIVIFVGSFLIFQQKDSEQIFCTQEVSMCSDGSYVGRTGPNCEFDCSNSQGGAQDISVYKDLIRVETPFPESEVGSPLLIKGKARGSWFFEASFPIVLTNWDGLIIAEGYATALEPWMTTEYVPFEAKLEFVADTSVSNRGSLILKKDNPSGLPEHDDAFEYTLYLR